MKKRMAKLMSLLLAAMMLAGCTSLEAPAPAPEPEPKPEVAAPAPSEAEKDAVDEKYPDLEPITFKMAFGSSQAETDAAHALICDEIESLSGGKIKIERYLQGQLFTADADGSIALAEGTVDMIMFGDMMVSAAAPEIAGFTNIPFAFDSSEHCLKFWNAVADQVNKQVSEKYGCLVLFDSLELRGPRVIASDRPITCAEDFQGLKMRLPAIAASVASFEALGCSPLTSSLGELYSVMDTGVANACESPVSTLESVAISEVCDYAVITNHTYSFRAAHVNEAWWNSLSDDHREIIQAGVAKGCELFNKLELEAEATLLDKWVDNGMTIVPHDDIDTEDIKEAVTPAILKKYENEWDMSVWDVIQETR